VPQHSQMTLFFEGGAIWPLARRRRSVAPHR
jgi:hypothetical protein